MNSWIGRLGAAAVAASTFGLFAPMTAAHASSALSGTRLHAANLDSPSQAGYISPAAATSKVIDKFTVPAITCSSSNTAEQVAATGAFIFGGTSSAPTESGAGVALVCLPGSASSIYVAFVVLNNTINTGAAFIPAPGDVMWATINESATATKGSIRDITQGKTYAKSSKAGGPNAVVLWGIATLVNSSTGMALPVPTFKTVPFASATQNGTKVGSQAHQAYDLKETTVVDISTSALKAAPDVDDFTLTFHHNG